MHPLDAAKTAFSPDYAAARQTFLDRAAAVGGELQAYEHPGHGPFGEALATDVAWFGPANAENVLVMISATHGAEGFCGSGIQCDWLSHGNIQDLPGNLGVLVIHAINPHGFAWLRRVTAEGVDLNRNFVDFTKPLPENTNYTLLADAIVPDDMANATLQSANARLLAFEKVNGREALQRAISGGQFTHPEGLFYGGREPTWSRRTTETIIEAYGLGKRRAVSVLDLHTGLGPFGYGELICDHPPGSDAVKRARRWWGDSVTEPALGTSSSVAKFGLSDYGWQEALDDIITFVTLEFGTYPIEEAVQIMRLDHILHRRDSLDWTAPEVQSVKQALRRQFYPDTDDWREMVLWRGRQVIRQAIQGLAK